MDNSAIMIYLYCPIICKLVIMIKTLLYSIGRILCSQTWKQGIWGAHGIWGADSVSILVLSCGMRHLGRVLSKFAMIVARIFYFQRLGMFITLKMHLRGTICMGILSISWQYTTLYTHVFIDSLFLMSYLFIGVGAMLCV